MPLGPMMARRSPRRTWRSTPSSTWSAPYDLAMSSALSTSLPDGRTWRELEDRVAARRARQPHDLDALDQLELRLRLPRLGGLGAEALDELLVVRDLLLLLGDLGFLALALGDLGRHEVGVVAAVEQDGLVVDVGDVGRDVVEEAMVVRDHQRAARVLGQELLEPADRQDVEVVGRLVEQQHVGRGRQHLRQQDAQLEAAGERRQRLVVAAALDAEPLEDLAGARLERVAVVGQDDVLELGVALAVELVRARAAPPSPGSPATAPGGPSSRRGRWARPRTGSGPGAGRRRAPSWGSRPRRRSGSRRRPGCAGRWTCPSRWRRPRRSARRR